MVCPEDRSITKNYVDKILQGGLASPDEDVIYRILGKDGYHWISDTTVKVELPGGTFLQCILSDVSRFVAEREQREAELERLLKASEERYEIIRALGTVYQDISVIDLKAQRYTLVSARNIDEQKTKELEYQKNLEEAAAEAHRANEAKTNFLRRMSHDKPLQINEVVAAIAHCCRKEP